MRSPIGSARRARSSRSTTGASAFPQAAELRAQLSRGRRDLPRGQEPPRQASRRARRHRRARPAARGPHRPDLRQGRCGDRGEGDLDLRQAARDPRVQGRDHGRGALDARRVPGDRPPPRPRRPAWPARRDGGEPDHRARAGLASMVSGLAVALGQIAGEGPGRGRGRRGGAPAEEEPAVEEPPPRSPPRIRKPRKVRRPKRPRSRRLPRTRRPPMERLRRKSLLRPTTKPRSRRFNLPPRRRPNPPRTSRAAPVEIFKRKRRARSKEWPRRSARTIGSRSSRASRSWSSRSASRRSRRSSAFPRPRLPPRLPRPRGGGGDGGAEEESSTVDVVLTAPATRRSR